MLSQGVYLQISVYKKIGDNYYKNEDKQKSIESWKRKLSKNQQHWNTDIEFWK